MSQSLQPTIHSTHSSSKHCCNIKNTCDIEDVKPAILDIPYPALQVHSPNKYYAKLLSVDYCSSISEFSAITQYINHETRLSKSCCNFTQTLLAIAQAEMIHLQKLGSLILLLGSPLTYDFATGYDFCPWSPDYVDYGFTPSDMILSDIKGEHQAITQYQSHISKIDDPCVQAVLERIILDEKYHIQLLSQLSYQLKYTESNKNSKRYCN